MGVNADASRAAAARPPESHSFFRRGQSRFRIRLCSGRIYDRKKLLVCYCMIRDASGKGARLLLPPNVSLEKFVWLSEDGLEEATLAEVRWQRGREAGILKRAGLVFIKDEGYKAADTDHTVVAVHRRRRTQF